MQLFIKDIESGKLPERDGVEQLKKLLSESDPKKIIDAPANPDFKGDPVASEGASGVIATTRKEAKRLLAAGHDVIYVQDTLLVA